MVNTCENESTKYGPLYHGTTDLDIYDIELFKLEMYKLKLKC